MAEDEAENSPAEDNTIAEAAWNRIKPSSITETMEDSFLRYSMSVIVARALPDVARRPQAGSPAHPFYDG